MRLPILFRVLLFVLTHTVYRLRVAGASHVPAAGGALLVPNHVSFADGVFVLASVKRPVRFIVDESWFRSLVFGPVLRALGAIPISSSSGPRAILRSLRKAGEHLDRGELVCVFAEGQITRTGMLLPFRRGLENIVAGRTAPIVPVHLDRVWGSIFSRSGGRFLTKLPTRIPYPVTVVFGEPLAPGTPIFDVRRAVQELSATAWMHRKPDRRPLHHVFVRAARWHPLRFAFADATRPRVGRFAALTGAVALARALRAKWQGQERVGILLPPSVACTLVNLAASLSGRATVNLNYTIGRVAMESATRQAGLRTVVTSREFLQKAHIEVPQGPEVVFVEEAAAAISLRARAAAALMAALAPVRILERACGAAHPPGVDDLVTVIFSSGSTGEPKGVLLTHFNVDSNVEAMGQAFEAGRRDRVLGVLPLFHSFGYMATLWWAANNGLGVVSYANPKDAAAVGELVQRFEITFLLATPTFLQLYMRRCTPAQFGSLRIVITGAEKLPERVAQAFDDRFGVRPLEGYGATECAPAIAVSTPDFRAAGFFQPGSRRGSVGQPLPGVAVRIVDPATRAVLPPEAPGLLLVKGANVMRGYFGREDLTAQVVQDGWYSTGDIAKMDEDGFIFITDRLARFSKIGGEMVPHGRIEEALQQAAGATEQKFAVTAVPDEQKGERLAVLYLGEEQEVPILLQKLAAAGLPHLFLPRADHFVRVATLPVLGSGKLDLAAVRQLARERLQQSDSG